MNDEKIYLKIKLGVRSSELNILFKAAFSDFENGILRFSKKQRMCQAVEIEGEIQSAEQEIDR